MSYFTDKDFYTIQIFDVMGSPIYGQCIVDQFGQVLYPGSSTSYGYEVSLFTTTSDENQLYYNEDNTDSASMDDTDKRTYPGLVWPYRDLKMELLYVYLDNELQNRKSTNCNLEIFLFDGAEIIDDDFINLPNMPCSSHRDTGGCDQGYDDYRWWRFKWLNNEEYDVHTQWNWWFDLTLSDNLNLPTINNVSYDIELGNESGYNYYETCDINCRGSREADSGNPGGEDTGNTLDWSVETYDDQFIQYNTIHLAENMYDWSKYINNTFLSGHPDQSKNFYIVIRTGASQDKYNGTDGRKNTYQTFVLPKSEFKNLVFGTETEKTIGWGNKLDDFSSTLDEIYPAVPNREKDNYGTPDGVSNPVFRCQGLAIRLSIPGESKNATTTTQVDNFPSTHIDETGWPFWLNLGQLNQIETSYFHPNKSISYVDFSTNDEIFNNNYIQDFRPISNVYISNFVPVMLQRYYDPADPRALEATALNKISISFDISRNYSDIVYLDEDQWENSTNTDNNSNRQIGYMFRVVRWGDESDINDGDLDYNLISNYAEHSVSDYPYRFVRESDGTNGTIEHTYYAGGIKTIKGFVFSYIYHPDVDTYPNYVQALRWKLVTIRLYIGEPSFQVNDFSVLGGYDFITLPWPHTTPIVSGIDEQSKYKKSIDTIVDSRLFRSDELIEYGQLKMAQKNNEMGTYIGKTDFEQIRIFSNGMYDMNNLLNITGSNEQFHSYGDIYWDGVQNQFSKDTSVGELYIGDNKNYLLQNDCILELNLGDIDSDTVYDSSGRGNRGILIGDYALKKPTLDISLTRETFMNPPRKGKSKKAL